MAFLGGFIAILIVAVYVYVKIKKKVSSFSRMAFGTADLIQGLKQSELTEQTTPKSLSGCDSLLMPRIRKDFPDFNVDLAKTYARQEVEKHLSGKSGVRVHDVVFNRYNQYNNERVIIMQASAQYKENGTLCQKRYELHYAYTLGMGEDYTREAANCPNCGAPSSKFGAQVCEFCGSRIAEVLSNTWEFTEIKDC